MSDQAQKRIDKLSPSAQRRVALARTRNSYTLQLDDKQETMIPLSKQSEKELQALLDY